GAEPQRTGGAGPNHSRRHRVDVTSRTPHGGRAVRGHRRSGAGFAGASVPPRALPPGAFGAAPGSSGALCPLWVRIRNAHPAQKAEPVSAVQERAHRAPALFAPTAVLGFCLALAEAHRSWGAALAQARVLGVALPIEHRRNLGERPFRRVLPTGWLARTR